MLPSRFPSVLNPVYPGPPSRVEVLVCLCGHCPHCLDCGEEGACVTGHTGPRSLPHPSLISCIVWSLSSNNIEHMITEETDERLWKMPCFRPHVHLFIRECVVAFEFTGKEQRLRLKSRLMNLLLLLSGGWQP